MKPNCFYLVDSFLFHFLPFCFFILVLYFFTSLFRNCFIFSKFSFAIFAFSQLFLIFFWFSRHFWFDKKITKIKKTIRYKFSKQNVMGKITKKFQEKIRKQEKIAENNNNKNSEAMAGKLKKKITNKQNPGIKIVFM